MTPQNMTSEKNTAIIKSIIKSIVDDNGYHCIDQESTFASLYYGSNLSQYSDNNSQEITESISKVAYRDEFLEILDTDDETVARIYWNKIVKLCVLENLRNNLILKLVTEIDGKVYELHLTFYI